jgi:hypothetical protein
MSDNYVKIHIGSDLDARGFDDAKKGFEEMDGAAKEFVETLKLGAGIDIGGRIVEGIAEIPNVLREAIAEGVRFNAELESMRLSLAGMQRQFSGGAIGSFNAGLAVSDGLISSMRTKANELGVSFEAMLETYKTTAGAMFQGGVTDLNKQVELSALLMRTMQGLGISGFMATRDTQDLLTGMADRTKAGRELGIRDEDIQKAKEAGTLYEFLNQKLSGFAEAGAAGAHTFTAEMERMHNEVQQLEAEVSKPIFEALRAGLADLNVELAKPEVQQSLENLGYDIAALVKGGMALVDWAVRNANVLVPLATGAGLFGVALAGLQIAKITADLGMWAVGLLRSSEGLTAETAALVANTAAQVENASARGGNAVSAGIETAATGASGVASGVGGAASAGGSALALAGGTASTYGGVRTMMGRTVYKDFGAVENPGAWIPNAGAGALGAGEATGGGVAAGSAAGVLAGATALGAVIGLAILEGMEQYKQSIREESANQTKDVTGKDGTAQLNGLLDQASGANSQTQDEVTRNIEKQMVIEQSTAQLEGVRGQIARERLAILQETLDALPQFVKSNDEQIDQATRLNGLERERQQQNQQELDRQETLQMQSRVSESALDTDEKMGTSSPDSRVKMNWLQEKEQRIREQFADPMNGWMGADKTDPFTATPEQLVEGSAKGGIGEAEKEEAIKAAEELSRILKEIESINKSNDDEVGKLVDDGEKWYLASEKAKESLTAQASILKAQAAGQYDVAAAAQQRLRIEEQISRLVNTEHVDPAEARNLVQGNADQQQADQRAQVLKSLEEEHAIEQAKLEGNKQLVQQLEQQKTLEEEIQKLESQGLSATEAKAQAQQRINDLKDEEARTEKRKREEVDADDTAKAAQARHARNAPQLEQRAQNLKRRHSLEDEFGTDQGDEIADREERSQKGGGRIGGPTAAGPGEHPANVGDPRDTDHTMDPDYKGAPRSARDTLGDRMSDADWHNQFSAAGGLRNHDLDPDSGTLPGLTPQDAWDKQFQPIGPSVPDSSFQVQGLGQGQDYPGAAGAGGAGGGGAPAAPAGGGGGAPAGGGGGGGGGGDNGLSGAAAAVQQAASATQQAATQLQTGATQLQSSVQQLQQIGTQLGTLGDTITSAIQDITQQIQTMQSEIDSISNSS